MSATDPADLCTGNPCIISSDATIDPVGGIDFGAGTQVRLATGVTLTVAAGATSADVTLSAGSIILEPASEIVAREGSLTLEAVAGNLELQSSELGPSKIRFPPLTDTPPGGPAADLFLFATGGDVRIDGMILGKQGSPLAGMGRVDVGATGSVIGTGRIDVRSPRLDEASLSPLVLLNADAIDFRGDILAGSGCQGGEVDVQAITGPLSLGFVDVSARGCASQSGEGLAGRVLVSTAGEGHLVDRIVARSRAHGGQVTLSADALFLAERIDARGMRGSGGSVHVGGGDVTMEDGAEIRVAGREGSGDVEITTSPFLTPGNVVLTSIRDGGNVRVSASGGIVVKGRLRTRSVASGPIELGSCGAVVIEPTALLDTRPKSGGTTAGDITISGDSIAVDGNLRATGGTGEIRLDYFTTAPVVTGTIEPGAIETQVAPPASCTGP